MASSTPVAGGTCRGVDWGSSHEEGETRGGARRSRLSYSSTINRWMFRPVSCQPASSLVGSDLDRRRRTRP
jgi:hypothetical protein